MAVAVAIILRILDFYWNFNAKMIKPIQGVVACDDIRCAQLGELALEKGGNAVDAVVASAVCMATLNQQSTGFGGYFSLIIH